MNQYPMNDLRNPLGKAFYDLTQQVEALGGSPELTAVVMAIGALRDQVGAAVQAAQPEAVGEVCKAMIRAWELGQVYAQQSHSEARSLESHTAFVALLDKTRAMLASAPPEPISAPTAPAQAEPVAWVRRHPDDTLTSEYLSDQSIEPVRKRSGGWVPLYAPPPATAAGPSDAERLDWLEQNLFHVEPDEWTAKYSPHLNTWRIFAPKGVQGSARTIIDAAIRATKGGKL